MAVRRDKSGRWRFRKWVRLPDGARTRISGTPTINTKAAATADEHAAIEHTINKARFPERYADPAPVSKEVTPITQKEVPHFTTFAEEFVANYAQANNKPSEVQSKRMIINKHLKPAFGKLRLNEITGRDIEAFKAQQITKRKLTAKTVNNHLAVLRRLLVLAHEWGIINTFARVQFLKAPKPEFDYLEFDEAEQLISNADIITWRPMITLALKTGLRLGELLALRWQDIDLPNKRLFVRQAVARGIVGTPKSGKAREVPLCDLALVSLKAHRHLRGPLIFCKEDGSMLTKEQCKHPLWRACKRAGLRRIGWHALRHTFASHLAMQGAPLKAVQELLGHSTIEMTMRYAHLNQAVRRDAVLLLDQTVGQNWANGQLKEAALAVPH